MHVVHLPPLVSGPCFWVGGQWVKHRTSHRWDGVESDAALPGLVVHEESVYM